MAFRIEVALQECARPIIQIVQGTFGTIQGTFGTIQGTIGAIQATFGTIQGTSVRRESI
jgi:hypothetical protein